VTRDSNRPWASSVTRTRVGKTDLPRSEVVSKVWEYIKKHDLQDAKDRRQINADEKLGKVFGKKSASMFEMNKHLSAHLTAKKS
jgi:chromatin remodeling complex protein RSC6